MSKDQVGWHIFCLGYNESCGNVGEYFQDDEDDGNGSCEGVDEEMTGFHNSNKETTSNHKSNNVWGGKSTVPTNRHELTTTLLNQFDQILM